MRACMRGITAVQRRRTPPAISAPPSSAMPRPSAARVVRDFCGHGVGQLFHDAPNILHYGTPGEGVAAEARHDLHHRADDQSRQAGREDPVRRLDRRDARPLAVGAVRAHRSASPRPAARSSRSRRAGRDNPLAPRMSRGRQSAPRRSAVGRPARPTAPHYHGHRDRLRAALPGGRRPTRCPTTSCSSCCCSARSRSATSSRSPRS